MKASDRRVLRTRRLLREALFATVLERGWEATSVQDVCARADVGRSTFYAHFADKEELLLSGFDDLPGTLRRKEGPLGFTRSLLEHTKEFVPLRRVIRKRTGEMMMRRLRKLVVDLVREDVAKLAPETAQREAAVRYVAGGFVDVMLWWLEANPAPAVDEVERVIRALSDSAIATTTQL